MQLVKTIYRCNPPEAAWNPAVVGDCHSQHGWSTHTSYLVGVWNIVSDFILAFYPVTMFSKLQMAFRVKVGLCVLMGLGIVAAVCGIMRTVLIPLAYSSNDPTYDSGPEVIWVWTEMWLVLIVSCVPPLWPLLRKCFRALRSEVFETSGGEFTSAPSGRSPTSSASTATRMLRLPRLKRPSPAVTVQSKEYAASSTEHLAAVPSIHSRSTSDDTTTSFVTLKDIKGDDISQSHDQATLPAATPRDFDSNDPITKDHYVVPRARDTVTEAQMREALRDSQILSPGQVVVQQEDEFENVFPCTVEVSNEGLKPPKPWWYRLRT